MCWIAEGTRRDDQGLSQKKREKFPCSFRAVLWMLFVELIWRRCIPTTSRKWRLPCWRNEKRAPGSWVGLLMVMCVCVGVLMSFHLVGYLFDV